MTPEIAAAFKKLREKFRSKLLTAPTQRIVSVATKAFDDAVQDFDKPPTSTQPDNETLWEE
jgi:hypothetical protein